MLRHLVNVLLYFLPPTRLFQLRLALLNCTGMKLQKNVKFCGRGWIYGRGTVEVGVNTWVGLDTLFYTHIEAPIYIGKNCDIGPGTVFVTGSHALGNVSRRAGVGKCAPIMIGDGCWLGARVTVLGGVSLGEGSIVAAGSVVIKNVPPNVLVGGVPARVIRFMDSDSK